MSRSEFEEDDNRHTPPRDSLFHGIVAASIVDTMVSAPIMLALPFVHPENVENALGKLLLSVNMFVGYVGGRVAARAGMSHEDSRSQWTMASVVSGISVIVGTLLARLRVVLHLVRVPQATAALQSNAAERASAAEFFLELVMVLLLIRFGFAMGTYSQAKREGRVQDEDEASAE